MHNNYNYKHCTFMNDASGWCYPIYSKSVVYTLLVLPCFTFYHIAASLDPPGPRLDHFCWGRTKFASVIDLVGSYLRGDWIRCDTGHWCATQTTSTRSVCIASIVAPKLHQKDLRRPEIQIIWGGGGHVPTPRPPEQRPLCTIVKLITVLAPPFWSP